jgi:hypothetical protein
MSGSIGAIAVEPVAAPCTKHGARCRVLIGALIARISHPKTFRAKAVLSS